MERLEQKTPNTPEQTDKQFDEVWTGELGGVDEERFSLLLSRYQEGKILDVGCFDSPLPIWNNEVVGLDHSPHTINTLRAKYPDAKYVCADAMKVPFADGFFDYIVIGETMEHIEDLEAFIKEMFRVLKLGGTIALSVPHDEANSQNVSDQHVWSFKIGDIHTLFEKHGRVSTQIYKNMIVAFIEYGRFNS